MKKEKVNDSLKNSSVLLMTVSGITLFLLVIFVSYSMFGNGKGTYSYTVGASCCMNSSITYDPSTKKCETTMEQYSDKDLTSSGYNCVNRTPYCCKGKYYDETDSEYYDYYFWAQYSSCYYTDNLTNTQKSGEYILGSSACSAAKGDFYCTKSVSSEVGVVQTDGTCSSSGSSGGSSGGSTNPGTSKTFKAIFDANGGTISGSSNGRVTKTCVADGSYKVGGLVACVINGVSSINVSNGDKIFGGWGTASYCETGANGDSLILFDEEIKYFACWGSNGSTGGDSNDDEPPASCTYEIKGGTGGTVNTGVSGCNGKVSYTGEKNLSDLEKCVSNSGKCIDNWTVKFENGTTKSYSYNINSADNDCGITLTPNWGTCSSGGSPGGSSGGTTTEAEYSETYKDDRCYNGEWVRVVACQPSSVTNAKCKLSDGTTVDRKTILSSRTGCDLLNNAYDKVIDDYRCDRYTGKWVYITSCQGISLVGAHCKYSGGTSLLTDMTGGSGCSGSKPSTSTSSDDKSQQDVDKNAQTGTIEVVISWIIGIFAFGVAFYYFRKNRLLNGK